MKLERRSSSETAQERANRVLRDAGDVHGGDGGLWRCPSLGPHTHRPWSHREVSCSRNGQTICKEGGEECCGDLRSRRSARCEVRSGQKRRAAGRLGTACGSVPAVQTTN